MSSSPSSNTRVLIVGGGLVGLSTGLFLQNLGVPFILTEKNREPSMLPRSRGIHVRTMELFRQVGVADVVRAAADSAWKVGGFGGARRGRNMLESEALTHRTIKQFVEVDPSPCSFCACPQPILEPVLRRPLEERAGDVRFGHELVSFRETESGVDATVRDADGKEAHVTASYLIGADGGRSFVRHQLGIQTVKTMAQQHFVNVFFRADLTRWMQGRTFSQCEIANDQVRGLFLSKNNTTDWSFHLEYDPSVDAPVNLPDAKLADLVKAAIGLYEIPLDILAKTTWSTSVRIAERYRSGRAFLVGDAAHVMPPWGGFNGNTGIADAHNLSWKLAAAVSGHAAPSLLDSYEEERRPVAVRNGRQALLRTNFDARFDIETEANHDVFVQLLDTGALLTRYRYSSTSTQSNEPVDHLQGQTGTRFPHAWIRRGTDRLSTLDLFGKEYVVIVGPRGPEKWTSRQQSSKQSPRLYMTGVDFQFDEDSATWHTLTGLPDDGAVRVRPDGFVDDRSDETLRPA